MIHENDIAFLRKYVTKRVFNKLQLKHPKLNKEMSFQNI